MYSTKDLIDIIKEHVSKLDLKWFEKKESEFKRNNEYSYEKDAIFIIDVQGYPIYGDEEEEIIGYEKQEIPHQFNFKEYCSCYLPICDATHWGSYAADFYDSKGRPAGKSNNIDELTYDLVKEIADFLKGEADVTIVHKFIAKELDNIEREIKLQKTLLDNEIYNSVLDDYLKLCTYKLYKRFEKELTRYNETEDYVGRLEFNLNQSELLSLLFLIQRAGFLNITDNAPLLRFCNDHFLYKAENNQFVKPTNVIALSKQYSKITTSQAPGSKQDLSINGLTHVSNKLGAIIKNLK